MQRLLVTLPLMAVAGWCLFGFVATFEPMPRIAQWIWRTVYLGARAGSLIAICWMWLASNTGRAAKHHPAPCLANDRP